MTTPLSKCMKYSAAFQFREEWCFTGRWQESSFTQFCGGNSSAPCCAENFDTHSVERQQLAGRCVLFQCRVSFVFLFDSWPPSSFKSREFICFLVCLFTLCSPPLCVAKGRSLLQTFKVNFRHKSAEICSETFF